MSSWSVLAHILIYNCFLLNISVLQVEAEPSQTIHDLKLRISERGIPVEAQNLLKTGNLAFSRSDCTVVLR